MLISTALLEIWTPGRVDTPYVEKVKPTSEHVCATYDDSYFEKKKLHVCNDGGDLRLSRDPLSNLYKVPGSCDRRILEA